MTEVARLRLGPRAPWTAVLARVFAAVAANSAVPIERVLDAQLALDQLAQGARAAGLEELDLSFATDGRTMRVTLGPAPDPGAILAEAEPPGIDGALARLADSLRIEETDGQGGCLVLGFEGGR